MVPASTDGKIDVWFTTEGSEENDQIALSFSDEQKSTSRHQTLQGGWVPSPEVHVKFHSGHSMVTQTGVRDCCVKKKKKSH